MEDLRLVKVFGCFVEKGFSEEWDYKVRRLSVSAKGEDKIPQLLCQPKRESWPATEINNTANKFNTVPRALSFNVLSLAASVQCCWLLNKVVISSVTCRCRSLD